MKGDALGVGLVIVAAAALGYAIYRTVISPPGGGTPGGAATPNDPSTIQHLIDIAFAAGTPASVRKQALQEANLMMAGNTTAEKLAQAGPGWVPAAAAGVGTVAALKVVAKAVKPGSLDLGAWLARAGRVVVTGAEDAASVAPEVTASAAEAGVVP